MGEHDTGRFEIFIENGDGRTDRDFLVETTDGEEAWTARKVIGLNAEMERDNPRAYARGRRYYYLAADLAVARRAAPGIRTRNEADPALSAGGSRRTTEHD